MNVSGLQQLFQLPEGAFAADRKPWNGNECTVFARMYEIGRATASCIRAIRDVAPDHAEVVSGIRLLRHLTRLKSWTPTGKAH